MWWIGFRQVRQKGSKGVELVQSMAVVCGPYETEAKANQERLRRLQREWEAAYSRPFEASSKNDAERLVEDITPRS